MRYAIFILFIAISITLCAQDGNTDQNIYTTKDGLSNNTVYSVRQDSRGFLWLGTKEGLNRFDGLQFKKFFSGKVSENYLSNNNIFDVLEYRYGQLLIATSNGISVYNSLAGKFENEKIKFTDIKAGSGAVINSFFKDRQGRIWINHSGELDILDSNLNYIERFTDVHWAKSLKGVLVRFESWYQDKNNRIWLPSDTTGINIIDFAAKQVWSGKNNPEGLAYLKPGYIRAFLVDENANTVWYAPWGMGLYKYNLLTNKQQHASFNERTAGEANTINSIIKNANRLYCCGEQLYEVDTTTLAFKSINKNYGISLFTTADKIFWEATEDGLIQLPDISFGKELSLNVNKNLQPGYCTNMQMSKSGFLYATYSNTLVSVNPDRTHVDLYRVHSKNNLKYTHVREDKAGKIWVGTSEGIYIFDADKKLFTKPSFLPQELTSLYINEIFCDSDGDMWVETRNPSYLYRCSAQQNAAEKITNKVITQFTEQYTTNRISAIAEDNRHNLWMTSQLGGGIICYNKKTGEWKNFPVHIAKNGILERGLTSIHTDKNNHLWLTDYFGNGLLCYDYSTDSLTQFSRNDGLLSDFVKNVSADTSGNLWLTTEYGINRFNVNEHSTLGKGLFNIKFSEVSLQQDAIYDRVTNCLVYGLDDHLQFVPVNTIVSDISSSAPVIDKVTINNIQKFVSPGDDEFTLAYDEKNIGIDFTSVQFSDADKIHFAYELTGVDKEWKYTDVNRSAQYANLSPGTYTFKIKTSNENNKWSSVYNLLSFTITPPWWQTWWFRLAAILAAGLLLYLIITKRIQQIKKESDLKHKISETEMMALRAQMNPHFIFNCLNAIDNLIQTDQKEKATTYLARFAKLIRTLLDSSKNNIIPFYKECEALNLFLQMEQFRCSNKFQYELKVDEELMLGDYKVPPLLAQPFIENAIHHGLMNKPFADKKLIVKIVIENEKIKYSIIDNGIGRAKAQQIKEFNKPEHVSYGIQISEERIQLYNKNSIKNDVVITDLYNNDGPSGTMVEVYINL